MIQCNNLVIGHTPQFPLCNPFNLSIDQNQWLGIVGENGTGKSTFLKTILGFETPIAGSLTLFLQAPGKNNQLISYIPQERELNLSPNTSALTLIKSSFNANRLGLPAFGKDVQQKAYNILQLVGALNYARKPFETLSGGQKKRIYLAQALINNPKLLLLDEPLSDLDPQAKQDFIQALKSIHAKQNITLLIISHDMHEIAHELDNFIHFKNQHVHLCQKLPCLKEDRSVIL
ncbi:metal ABC transporter ATP-binding protein [Cysteiniphilum halobium]|uniref:metal ABC transporter ATP-binding protein n=1 Tax=Cysteiniphilum halobium TaxID=2219059 RepID=UPI0013C345B6|nr:ATP-binding cassette domain-containing protein [Cysteiniphilum halobium]